MFHSIYLSCRLLGLKLEIPNINQGGLAKGLRVQQRSTRERTNMVVYLQGSRREAF